MAFLCSNHLPFTSPSFLPPSPTSYSFIFLGLREEKGGYLTIFNPECPFFLIIKFDTDLPFTGKYIVEIKMEFQGNEEDEGEEKALAEAYELNRRLKQMALAGGDDVQAFLQQMNMGMGGEEGEERQRHEQYARQQRQLEMRQQMLAAQMKENPIGGKSDGERGRFDKSNAVGGGVGSENVQSEIEQRTLMRANARQRNGGNVRKGGNAMRQKSNYSKCL